MLRIAAVVRTVKSHCVVRSTLRSFTVSMFTTYRAVLDVPGTVLSGVAPIWCAGGTQVQALMSLKLEGSVG